MALASAGAFLLLMRIYVLDCRDRYLGKKGRSGPGALSLAAIPYENVASRNRLAATASRASELFGEYIYPMPLQNYISNELTHFVGRNLEHEDEQYKLLAEILRSNWLTHPPHDPGPSKSPLAIRLTADSIENMYMFSAVCFCDIPQDDLEIHMRKYSRFGLSFRKSFLIPKGANPVFYVAKDSKVEPRKNDKGLEESKYEPKKWRELVEDGVIDTLGDEATRYEYFNNRVRDYLHLPQDLPWFSKLASEAMDKMQSASSDQDREHWLREVQKLQGLERRIKDLYTFLDNYVFSFAKFFDGEKHEEAEDNYYMEREWRILGNVHFEVPDVYRVILPESCASRFRSDFPSYTGQVTFSDAA